MLRECATYVNSEILQTFKLAQVYLQFGVNLQAFGFGILEEGPELLQSIKLAWGHETATNQSPWTEEPRQKIVPPQQPQSYLRDSLPAS